MPPNGFNHPFSTCGKGSSKKIDLRFLSWLVNDGQHFLAFLEILFEINLISNRYNWRIRSNGNHTRKNSAASRSDLKEIQERKLTPQWSNPRLLKPRWACNVCGFSHPKTQSLVENEPLWKIICILAPKIILCETWSFSHDLKGLTKIFADKRNLVLEGP